MSEFVSLLTDTVTSIASSARERMTNPLLRSYLFFSVIVNWRVLAILFLGGDSIKERFELVDKHALNWWFAYGIPAGCSILFCWLMPHLLLVIRYLTIKPIEEIKIQQLKHKTKIEEHHLEYDVAAHKRRKLQDEREAAKRNDDCDRESRKEMAKVNVEREQLLKIIDEMNKKNRDFQDAIQQANRDVGTLNQQIKDLATELSIRSARDASRQADLEQLRGLASTHNQPNLLAMVDKLRNDELTDRARVERSTQTYQMARKLVDDRANSVARN